MDSNVNDTSESWCLFRRVVFLFSEFQHQHHQELSDSSTIREGGEVSQLPWESSGWCLVSRGDQCHPHIPALWSPPQLLEVRVGRQSILPCLSWRVCDEMSGQAPWCLLIISSLSLLCAVGGSLIQIRQECFLYGVTWKHTVKAKCCVWCLIFLKYNWNILGAVLLNIYIEVWTLSHGKYTLFL